MMTKEELKKIKVEITLADLVELQEKANFYYMLQAENEFLKKELYSKKED